VTVSPVAAMPTEEEAEARSIGVIARGISVVIPPIGVAAMVMTTVTPAASGAIVDGFCCTTGVDPDVLEAGYRRCRANGTKFGRKPKLNAHQQKEARRRLDAGESARAIGKDFDVHHATVLRVLDA
jgi:hypothetical protein